MPTNDITPDDIDDLTLAVLYLTAWREQQTGTATNWKGHNFDTLDSLAAKQYTDGNRRNKSLYLTEAGEAKAQDVIKRLLGKDFVVR